MDQIIIEVKAGDALKINADVLILKFAQALHGVDLAVAKRLCLSEKNLPGVSKYKFIHGRGRIGPSSVLFIGVPDLWEFRYKEIRKFTRKALTALLECASEVEHVALTIHGPGYGLDEIEAFDAQVAGLIDSIASGKYPPSLRTITIVELDSTRARRLKSTLARLLPKGILSIDAKGNLRNLREKSSKRLEAVGQESDAKAFIFVAMPFAAEMDDVFHYGIQNAVNEAGFLCERADLSSFTGDVVGWVKKRISDATFVIGDLSMANPNVYLEIGYAWGCGKPTILLVNNSSDLKFDVKTQRCLIYRRIKDLEESLKKELKQLRVELK